MKGTYFSRLVWRNTVLATVEMAAAMGGHALLLYFMARQYGPAAFGVVTLATTIATAAIVCVSFGSQTFGMRLIASGSHLARSAPGLMMTFQLVNAAVLLPLLAVGVWTWPTSMTERAFILITVAAIPADSISGVVRSCFYGQERFLPVAVLNTAVSCAILAMGLISLCAGVSLVTLGSILVALTWIRAAAALDMHSRMIGPLQMARPMAAYRAIARPSFSFFLVFVLSTAQTRAAVPIVRWLLGPAELGLYGIAASAVGAVAVMIQPLATSLFPAVAQQTGAARTLNPKRAFRTLLLPLTAGACAAAAISPTAGFLVRTFLDPSYAGSVLPLRVLAWSLPMVFVSSTALRLLMACGRAGTAARILAVSCAVNIVANLALVPVAGIAGAALSGVLSAAIGVIQAIAALARSGGQPVNATGQIPAIECDRA